MKTISLKIENRVGYILINKPKANSYDIDFMKLMAETIDQAVKNENVKVIAVKSELEKFFCAGADVKAFQQNTTAQNKEMVKNANLVAKKLAESPKITVALLSGHTLGGGLELALACDIRLASDGQYFIGLPEANLGLMPGNGGTQRLIRLVNQSKALELLISGESIMPDDAFDMGLVNQLYPKAEFENSSKIYLEKLALGPLQAMKAIKESVYKGIELSLEKGLELETKLADGLYETEDAKEGLKSFVEKRKPIFK
ncbi:enoyl-CoA hydratase/isomerase family protein [Gelidibacter salicanalis]|uniref:Enoyl-CoA hydratase/isomerase family protein n=1 Tax=Gelidibacter salicanalis TaxID=291193 RepID=A0A934KSX6_9FLAO|nr:enoyl-CoA hydratase/isomerase family protein [Gelidibacter salicanalis]MBJ7880143.1 enoyl-CoA hydratase/isomerase family protein [Gelidibacter salicanalis]